MIEQWDAAVDEKAKVFVAGGLSFYLGSGR